MQVDAVTDGKRSDIAFGNLEEVAFVQFTVSVEEVAAGAGELRFDHSLDTSVFDDVAVHAKRRTVFVASVTPFRERSIEGMSDLMERQHMADVAGHVFPYGHDKGTRTKIERCRTRVRIVLDMDGFLSSKSSEEVVRTVGNCCNHTLIIP